MGKYWLIRGREELAERLEFLSEHLIEKDVWPIQLEVKKYVKPRSINQNNLHWMWCGEMAKAFTKGGKPCSKDEVHMLLRHKFLGYEDVQIGSIKIERQLRSTVGLDTGEMQHFMEQQEEWAANLGVRLTIPRESEYWELREKQKR